MALPERQACGGHGWSLVACMLAPGIANRERAYTFDSNRTVPGETGLATLATCPDTLQPACQLANPFNDGGLLGLPPVSHARMAWVVYRVACQYGAERKARSGSEA